MAKSQKWYDAVCKANAKRRGKKLSKKHRAKLSRRRKRMWRDKKYRARVLAARKKAAKRPEVKARRKAAGLRSWQGKKGANRRKHASNVQRDYMLNLPPKEKARRTAERVAGARKKLKKLWRDKVWRAMMLKKRQAQARRDPELARRAARALWNGPTGEALRKERRDRWLDPAYAMKMAERFRTKGPCWYHKHPVHILMRSFYEVMFARWCDLKGIVWQYEPKTFPIDPKYKCGVSYLPDFYIPVLDTYVQIKGRITAAVMAKLRAVQRTYPSMRHYFIPGKGLIALRAWLRGIPRRIPIYTHVKGAAA